MTTIAGILAAALLFGLFAALRPRDRDGGCSGTCVGCARNKACENDGVKR